MIASDSRTAIQMSARRRLVYAQRKNQASVITTGALRKQTLSLCVACPLRLQNTAVGLKSLGRKPMTETDLPMVDLVGLGINSLDTLIRLPHFPVFNSKVQISSSATLPGGQVATAAVACQRWGMHTRYIGKIGDDSAGELQREEFEREKVEAHLIRVPHCASQTAFILVDEATGVRTILWSRDSRLDPVSSDLRPEWFTRARLLHVDGHPAAPAAIAAKWASDAGVLVTADLDNLYPHTEALLEHVDYLISSQEFPF